MTGRWRCRRGPRLGFMPGAHAACEPGLPARGWSRGQVWAAQACCLGRPGCVLPRVSYLSAPSDGVVFISPKDAWVPRLAEA